jgi:hypothetical protein
MPCSKRSRAASADVCEVVVRCYSVCTGERWYSVCSDLCKCSRFPSLRALAVSRMYSSSKLTSLATRGGVHVDTARGSTASTHVVSYMNLVLTCMHFVQLASSAKTTQTVAPTIQLILTLMLIHASVHQPYSSCSYMHPYIHRFHLVKRQNQFSHLVKSLRPTSG